MDEVNELLNYIASHPTVADILSAVYKVQPARRPRWKPVNQDAFEEAFRQMPQLLEQAPERPPSDFMESFQYAEAMLERLNKGRKPN